MDKYINNLEKALTFLESKNLIGSFEKDGDFFVVYVRPGKKSRMTPEMTAGFIEGVLSQNLEVTV